MTDLERYIRHSIKNLEFLVRAAQDPYERGAYQDELETQRQYLQSLIAASR